MKGKLAVMVFGLMLAVASVSWAEEAMEAATEGASEVIEVENKICPIEGGAIDEAKAAHVVYNGKMYHLCCENCMAEFQKDPDGYVAKIEASMAQEPAAVETMPAASESSGSY